MQLKSIEIIGFKSFADKTRINFPAGMTGIVGPNGSGKSNIAESIRWVLGEQSAKNLRGSRMPDVIFSGSTDRRSLNMASVTLTLDNTDQFIKTPYSELKISRKLFRNGDSSYYINENQCRLKDITDLFMDTGIGQGSLSIISQGNVENIFNSKPIERRSIIENVAGVYKYKQHKLTAQKEIDQTVDNLNRVDDIIHEIKKRLDPLEEQSSLATDYLDQTKKLQRLKKKQLIITATRLITDTDQLRQTVDQKEQIVDRLSAQIHKREQSRAQLKATISQQRSLIEKTNQKLLDLTQQVQTLKSQHQLSEQAHDYKSADFTRINQHINSNKQQIKDLQLRLNHSADDQQKLAETLTIHQQQFDELIQKERQNNPGALEKKIETLRNHYVDLLQEQTSVKNQINLNEHDNQRLSEQLRSRHQRIDLASDHLTKTKEQILEKKKEISKTQVDLADINQQLTELTATLSAKQSTTDHSQANWLTALKVAEQAKAKLNSLQSLHDSYRSFYRGVANLLKYRNEISGVIGPVADYLDIEPKFVKAIDIALGSQSQHVIVQDNSAASAAIQLLTRKRLGRVTLLPISVISARTLSNQLVQLASEMTGYIGIAADLVSMPAKMTSIKKFLLGRTIIADQLDNAILISQKIQHRTRVVTLDGQIVNAGGSLTGGANRTENEGVLVQKTELISLQKATQEMAQRLKKRESDLSVAKQALSDIKASLERGKQKKFQASQTLSSRQADLAKLETSFKNQQREVDTLKLSLSNSLRDTASADDATLESQADSIQHQLDETASQVSQKRDQLNHVKELVSQYAVQKQTIQKTLIVTRQQLKQSKEKEVELRGQIDMLKADQQKQQCEIEKLSKQLGNQKATETLKLKIKQLMDTQIKLNQQLTATKQQVATDEQQLDLVDRQLNDQRENLNHATYELTVDRDQYRDHEQQLQTNLVELKTKHQIDRDALEQLKLDLDSSDVERQIKVLQMGIAEIGSVNVSAIQEFKEVSKRYDFLSQQRQDLIDAKNHLTATMSDMDTTINQKFSKAFSEVAETFSKVFVDMFGGGEAKLILTDPADMLTSGVEIMVKPPGKNYRSLSLLSGGEKALTAITLLFAIIKVRPVPFCILDEAEAALDPFNADRFAKYLKRFGDDTQFIVITHRKETMIYADQLYGITMQESGVSKVVTVNLDNLKTEVS